MISFCSLERLKAYLKILATPGRDPTKHSRRNREQYAGSCDSLEWMFQELRAHLQGPDVEDEKARPMGDKCDLASSENGGSEWMRLQLAVQNLPLDVNLLIRDALLEESFGPGKTIVFPIYEPSYLQHFRALNRQLEDKYHYIYYSQNMWVIEEGPADWKFQYSYEFMPYQFSQIRKLTLAWTRRDYHWEGLEIEQFIDWQIEEGGTEGMDNLRAMGDFAMICDKATHELKHTWGLKLDMMSSMKLEYLIIDARDAFAPDGQYLGLAAAHECRWSRFSNFPIYLQVLAPGSGLADQIYKILVAKSLSWG